MTEDRLTVEEIAQVVEVTSLVAVTCIDDEYYKWPKGKIEALKEAARRDVERETRLKNSPFPATGLEPPGCPTPGACSCPPESNSEKREDEPERDRLREWVEWVDFGMRLYAFGTCFSVVMSLVALLISAYLWDHLP